MAHKLGVWPAGQLWAAWPFSACITSSTHSPASCCSVGVQGVNTDQVLGTIVAELEQQDDLKVAFHLEPYEGEPMCCTAPGPGGGCRH
jgi:hypothetical protein